MSDPCATEIVTIVNKKGLHARASAKLSKLAGTFETRVEVSRAGVSADARSLMDLLMLVAHAGSEIEIRCEGPEAVEAVAALSNLVASGFGEGDH